MGFIQLTTPQSFLPSLVVCHFILVSWYSAKIQEIPIDISGALFLHNNLFPRTLPHYLFLATLASPNSNLHLINSARLPGSIWFPSFWVYSLEIASRQKASIIIELILFLFSQGSQSYADCCPMSKSYCFLFYPAL